MRARSLGFCIWVAVFLATGARAVVLDSVWRETSYSGGLAQPEMMGDAVTSTALGGFDHSLSDLISAPGVAEAGASVSQLSSIDLQDGVLSILVSGDAGNHATSLVVGGIADSLSWSELEVVFTTSENALLTVDLFVSSSLGVFFDGAGDGAVETSHIGSILICVVGGSCLADILVDDLSDNGLAVSDGVVDSVWLPPGQYAIELLAVSQSLTPDVGSAQGAASFSGEISVQPAPEPAFGAGLAAGGAMLGLLARARRKGRAGRRLGRASADC